MSFLTKNFLSEEGEKNLLKYKYSGSDRSLIYKYFLSPAAQFLVDHILPTWLAPNTITFIGFICTLIPHLLIFYNNPTQLSGPIPSWICFTAAGCNVLYMVLDNADGKQARKTGTSSPLGQLFDHNCDAKNTFLVGINLFAAVQFGNGIYSIIGYIVAFYVFFMAIWEEYWVESLNLPWFNGPNEGLMGLNILFVVTGIMGTEFWTRQLWGFEYYQILVIAYAGIAVITVTFNFIDVYRKVPQKFGKALAGLTVELYLVATLLITYYFSTTDTVSRTCRYLIYFVGFCFAKLVGILQACHCANVEFEQYRLSILIPVTLLNCNTIIGHITKTPLINEDMMIYSVCAFSLLAYLHFIFNIFGQYKRVLGIKIFSITKDPLRQPLKA
jgi:ethanolaminephosphotransferase